MNQQAAGIPVTKPARQAQVAAILDGGMPVRSQEELAARLAERGVRVTQATLSRDLEELGAVRLRGRGGALVYALPVQHAPGQRAPVQHAPGQHAPGQHASGQAGGPAPGPASAPAPGTSDGPNGRLARVAGELLISAEASANLVVLRTAAGAAQLLASVIDQAGWPSVLGTVGGDDTVLVIARDPAGGDDLAQALVRIAGRRGRTRGAARPSRT